MTVQDSDTLKSYFNLAKVTTPSMYNDLVDTIFAQSSSGEIGEHAHDDRYVQLSISNVIPAVHTFNPSTYSSPFVLGPYAQGQTVIGLKADQLNRDLSVSGLGLSGGGILTSDRNIALASSNNPGATASILASNPDGILSLLRINTDIIGDRSGSNLTLSPTGDIVLDPVGNDVYPLTNYDLNLGLINKKFLALHAAELWVETLVASSTLATIGGRILVGPTTILTSDLGESDTTIYVKHNQMAMGDMVYMEANGKVEFILVVSDFSGTGPYSYTVSRNEDGSGANAWYAGDAVFNTGNVGDGFIDIYSVRSVKSETMYGPTIVGNVRYNTIYNNWTEYWALGNLNGIYGYGVDTYGFAAGKYANGESFVTVDATNGVRILARASSLDTTKFQIQADGDVFIGENISAAATTFMSIFVNAQTYNGEAVSAGDVLLGDNSASKANILWDKSTGKLLFRGGTFVQVEVGTDGAIYAGGGKVIIDSDGIRMLSDSEVGINSYQSILWMDNTDTYQIGILQTYYDITNYDVSVNLEAHAQSNYNNSLYIFTHNNYYDGVSISMDASGDTAATAYIRFNIDAVTQFTILSGYNLSYYDMRISTGLVVGSGATDPGPGEAIITDKIFVNETANTKLTIGLTLNQGANDDEIISLKSSDVAHGITDFTETDTYGALAKREGSGGLSLRGLSGDVVGLQLLGFGINGSTTKSASAIASMIVSVGKKSGTGYGAYGSDENLLVIRNYTTTTHIFDADGDFWYTGVLQSYKNSTVYSGYIYVPLLSPLTSTSWDGDSFSTTSKTLINLSSVFGIPAGVKGVVVYVSLRDSGSGSGSAWIILAPNNTENQGLSISAHPANDRWTNGALPVPCDANGDLYYQCQATGSGTLDIILEIWGYWI